MNNVRSADRAGSIRRRGAALAGLVLAAAAAVTIAIPAQAASVYRVSPTGNDSNPGTSAAPFRTMSKALARLRAGDSLVVAGGTYVENINLTAAKGTSGAPIRVSAAAGERPVIQGLLWVRGADYWTFDGVNVTWNARNSAGSHMVKMTGGVGWRITNAEIWGAHSYAAILVAGTPSHWSIDHDSIHDTYKSNSTNQDHLIYVNGGMGGGVIERNILAHSVNGRGIKIGPPSSSSKPIGGVVIRYNTMVDNRGPSNIQLSYGASDVTIYRNLMLRSGDGKSNVTLYNLNGTGNQAHDNIGWQSDAVLDKGQGFADAGSNRVLDPGTVDESNGFHPTNSSAASYGRFAD